MLCQNCNKRIATVHVTQLINNKKVEMYLCEQCAREKGQMDLGSHFNLNELFGGIMGYGSSREPYRTSVSEKLICDKCSMSYSDFKKTGKLGCSRCYEVFNDKLSPLVRRIHGNVEHQGKLPSRISPNIKNSKEIRNLKQLLNKAIQNEEYEKAAKIRDEIRQLEKKE